MKMIRIVLLAVLLAMWLSPQGAQAQEIPRTITGVEISTVRGWWAKHYLWPYLPERSTVHPLPSLHEPGKYQSPEQMLELVRTVRRYGSGVDVIQYNPNPTSSDHNQLLASGFLKSEEFANRPFIVAYENANGTRFFPPDDNGVPKDMNDPRNQQVFREDIEWIVREIILPNQSRYLTRGGKALIYIWSVANMSGPFGALLEEAKARWPIAFIGSINSLYLPTDFESSQSFQALDGFMEYALYPVATEEEKRAGVVDYNRMKSLYITAYIRVLDIIRRFEGRTGRRYLFIPTMQFAFDDTKWPGRRNTPMYAKSRAEVEAFAKLIDDAMNKGSFSPYGPLLKANENFEGDAVGPSQCLPETLDTPTRFVGCGYSRLEIARDFFSF